MESTIILQKIKLKVVQTKKECLYDTPLQIIQQQTSKKDFKNYPYSVVGLFLVTNVLLALVFGKNCLISSTFPVKPGVLVVDLYLLKS